MKATSTGPLLLLATKAETVKTSEKPPRRGAPRVEAAESAMASQFSLFSTSDYLSQRYQRRKGPNGEMPERFLGEILFCSVARSSILESAFLQKHGRTFPSSKHQLRIRSPITQYSPDMIQFSSACSHSPRFLRPFSESTVPRHMGCLPHRPHTFCPQPVA